MRFLDLWNYVGSIYKYFCAELSWFKEEKYRFLNLAISLENVETFSHVIQFCKKPRCLSKKVFEAFLVYSVVCVSCIHPTFLVIYILVSFNLEQISTSAIDFNSEEIVFVMILPILFWINVINLYKYI